MSSRPKFASTLAALGLVLAAATGIYYWIDSNAAATGVQFGSSAQPDSPRSPQGASKAPEDAIPESRVGANGSTFGKVPTGEDGAANFTKAPDFIAVLGGSGSYLAGYARRDQLDPAKFGNSPTQPIPVFNDGGREIVGYIVSDGRGFVPLGELGAEAASWPK